MEEKKLSYNQKLILKRRGMNPDHYVLVKDLYGALWVKNIHTGKIKVIDRKN